MTREATTPARSAAASAWKAARKAASSARLLRPESREEVPVVDYHLLGCRDVLLLQFRLTPSPMDLFRLSHHPERATLCHGLVPHPQDLQLCHP